MTRDVAALLSASYMIFHNEETGHLQTRTGTPDYTLAQATPAQDLTDRLSATASAGNKWMYATGTVRAYPWQGPDVVNDNLAQGYDAQW
jgi:hypothetical protein